LGAMTGVGATVGTMLGDSLKSTAVNPVNNSACCLKCGAVLSPNAKFCMECGEKVSEISKSETSGAKFCPNCGTETDGAKFCPNCGTKL